METANKEIFLNLTLLIVGEGVDSKVEQLAGTHAVAAPSNDGKATRNVIEIGNGRH